VLVPVAEDTPIVYDFKAAALSDLKQRYTSASITHLLSAATALDPRFRDFNFIRDGNERGAKLQAVREALAQKAAEISAEEPNEPDASAGPSSDDAAAEPPAKRARGETDLVSFLTEDDDTDQQPDQPSIEQQITAYYTQPTTAATDPLVFWKAAATTCPSLAALARRLLAIPGSSVPCERLFSTAGLIVTDLRARLSPESVAMLLFLNKNVDL